jgi:tetratricopeptide (TPR) repeat protein
MIPRAYYSGPAETNRFEKLAGVIGKIREEDWARECFRQLYLASLERNSGSKWRDIEAHASVIRGVAEWGQARLANDLARAIPIPEEESSEGALLQPAAKPSALAQLGSVFAEIHRTDPRLGAISEAQSILAQAVSAGAEVTSDMSQGEVCAAQIKVWIEARRSGLPLANRAEWEAQDTAEKMATEKHVSKWSGLAQLARARAEAGEGEKALALAKRIAEDKDREGLIVELAGKLSPHSFNDVIECWKEISTSDGRRRAAWDIARAFFDRSQTRPGRVPLSKTTWTPFSTFGSAFVGGFLPGLILLLGLPATLYWLVWKAIPLVKQGVSGPQRSLWLAGVSAAVLVALIALSRSLRNDVRNIFKRVGLSILLIAVSPLLLGYLAFEKYQKARPRLRVKKFLLRKLLSPSPRAARGARPRETPPQLDDYRKLLRDAVNESGPFDILFGSMLYHLPSVPRAASLSARLPEMRLPDEVPEKLKKDRQEYKEIERSFGRTHALRKALVNISSKVGIWVTGGFLAPLVLATILLRNNRERRAHRVAARGDKHLNAGRYDKAVRLLRRATRLAPDVPHYWHDYSVALSRSGKTEESIKAHHEATQRGVGTRDEPQFWYALGYTLFNAGRWEEALSAFEEVLKIAPRDSSDYTEASNGRDYCLTNLGRSMRAGGWRSN